MNGFSTRLVAHRPLLSLAITLGSVGVTHAVSLPAEWTSLGDLGGNVQLAYLSVDGSTVGGW